MRKEVAQYLRRMPARVVLEMEEQRLERKRQKEEAKNVVPMADDDDESGSGGTSELEDAKEFWEDVLKRPASKRARAQSALKNQPQSGLKKKGPRSEHAWR